MEHNLDNMISSLNTLHESTKKLCDSLDELSVSLDKLINSSEDTDHLISELQQIIDQGSHYSENLSVLCKKLALPKE